MMAVEVRPASAGPEARQSPAADRRALSADNEPRTLAARKAYPEEPASPKPEPEEDDAPLDLSVRKEISVCDFARLSFADPADYVRTQMILKQSQDYLASGRDSGTESDDSAGRLSPRDDDISGKAYKKSLMKRYMDGEPAGLPLSARSSLSRALLLLAPGPTARHHLYTAPNTGSLPPSPADSGVSDVESSSSGAGSAEELKARLQPPPPAPFHAPFLPFYQHHQIANTLQHHATAHPRPPVGGGHEREAHHFAAAAARRAALLRVRLRRLPAASPPQQAQAQEEAARRGPAHARREAQEPRGLHHLPVGVPAEAAAGPRVLPALHQVDQPREGRVQAGGLEGGVAPVGAAQEQARHELRDDGARAALLLPARHPRQGGRPAPRLPVRRRAQGHRRDRLLAGVGRWNLPRRPDVDDV